MLLAVILLATGAFGGGSNGGHTANGGGGGNNESQAAPAGDTKTSNAAARRQSDERVVIQELESILGESAFGRAAVVNAVSFPCADTSDQAIGNVISNRTMILTNLENLDTNGNSESERLRILLHDAIDLSLQSNYSYQAWFADLGPGDCGSPFDNSNFREADALSKRATDAKQQFVDAFDPIAARFGLRQWAINQF